MANQGRFQGTLIFGLVVGLAVVCARAEKPDVMRILTRHQQYRSLTQAADMLKMVSFLPHPHAHPAFGCDPKLLA